MSERDPDAVRAKVPDADGPRFTPGDAEQGEPRSRWGAVFNLVMFIIGGLALAWMLHTISWDELHTVVLGIGGWAALVFGLDLLAMCLDAAAWHTFMRPEARMVPYARVLGAWASGRAINILTPTGALGEPTKVTMLLGHAPRARVLSSLVLINVSMLYLAVSVMVIGIPITLLLIDLPDPIKVIVGAGIAVLVPAMVALGFVIHRGAMATAIGLLRRARLISSARAASWRTRLADVDRHIRELTSHRSAGTRHGFWLVLAAKTVSVSATMVLIHAVGVDLTAPLVIAVMSVGVLIGWISSVVPLGLGLSDGGNYALYALLGASGLHGMVVTMVSRARSVAIAAIGLVAMATMTALGRRTQRRIRDKLIAMKARLRRRRLRASRRPRRTAPRTGTAPRRAS